MLCARRQSTFYKEVITFSQKMILGRLQVIKLNNVSGLLPNSMHIRTFKSTPSCWQDDEEENIVPISKIEHKIGFIGDGNMSRAICRGITSKGLINFNQIHVSSPYIKNLDKWKVLGANVTTDNGYVAKEADVVFLAVKPHIMQTALEMIKQSEHYKHIKNKLFISILAGFRLQKLEEMLSVFEGSRVIRIMPNTPMMVGQGCTAYCPGKNVTDYDVSLARAILEATGMCQRVPEVHINAVTAVSGAGPSFAYLLIEALSDGGVRMGMHRDLATKFAAQTILGAATMVLETGKHTGQLKDQVCSAGGATIAGMHELERGGVRGAIMNAVEAAALKADQLGNQF